MVYEMRNDETGEIAATTKIVGLHIDAKARKARPLPDDVRALALMMTNREDWVDGVDSEPLVQMTVGAEIQFEHSEQGTGGDL